ncbi:DUF4115 domain-containing protein [Paucibacter sp. APW11]|uniref:DUF4115 domain-containing protein n=1 Tax=Roseateles aquae TaxID=3077235 RepID=A0ABU3P8I0_9BURK|nr:RodZ domain-containing protein [Paucibacter sp. APW11]MDT8998520.1 DUF4115 domain-containing protein [Paucibacter sp. APW11]
MTTVETEAPTPRAAPQTAGACLREARLARGMHIAALAALLKVPQAKLEALEADRHQDLPDATFARALAKAMCRALKVDAAPVLALLPKGQELELDRVSKGLNQPFRERMGRNDGPSLDWLKRPAVLAPLGLLVAAAVVYFLPPQWLNFDHGSSPSTASTAATDAGVPLAATPDGSAAPAAASAVQAVIEAASQPATGTAINAPAPSNVAAAPATPVATNAVPPAASVPPPSQTTAPLAVNNKPALTPTAGAAALSGAALAPLHLRAHADTWVEVVDARGQVLISKLLRSGEQADLQVQAPLKLRVGNVAGTELLLRGEKVDLAAVARDNVARLDLQ